MLDQIFRNMTPVVKNLLILNVLFFIAQFALPNIMDQMALYPIGSENFRPWQLATHFFMHSKTIYFHIIFNMFAVVMFGPNLERVWGARKFLFYYLSTGLGAALIYSIYVYFDYSMLKETLSTFQSTSSVDVFDEFWSKYSSSIELTSEGVKSLNISRDALINGHSIPVATANLEYLMNVIIEGKYNSPMLGASGAVFGVLVGFGYLFPNTELMLLFPPIPIKAKFLVIGYIALELYLGFANNPQDHVAHFAHLGGALIGILLVLFWQKDKRNFY